MTGLQTGSARLSDQADHIIDSNGQKVDFDDPRIVHVWMINTSPYIDRIMKKVYEKKGRSFRTVEKTGPDVMQFAKKICSGRECLPLTAMAGAMYKDILYQKKTDEIAIYLTLDEPGPCQYGAWPVIWDTLSDRLKVENAIFGLWPCKANTYLGMGSGYSKAVGMSFILGDLFEEAKNTLQCLAKDKDTALKIFEEEVDRVAQCFLQKERTIIPALHRWAEKTAQIPLTGEVKKTSKILIFGGLNVFFIHYPLTTYFIEQGIIPKLVDITEGTIWLRSHIPMRYGFKKGRLSPKKQFSLPRLILSWLFEKHNKLEAHNAIAERVRMLLMDIYIKRYRNAMAKSGLLFDTHVPFLQLAGRGHRHATYNGFTETSVTTGRYMCAVENGDYDGLINLGAFNCQPAMNSQATIRPLANSTDIPYAAVDCEGPWISSNQKRLLETIAVQAKRVRKKKNKMI